MREPENGKRTYEQIEIPKELEETVNRAVHSVDKRKSAARYRRRRMAHMVRNIGVAAAAVLLCMTVGVNTNEVLAKELGQLPVIGSLVRVLTITSYHEEDGSHDITVNVPEIEVEKPEGTAAAEEDGGTGGMSDADIEEAVNAQIQEIVDAHVAQAKEKFAEYKDAFFATGGTEEEWGDRTMDINVDYEVKYQEGSVLSLVLTTSEVWVAAQELRYYYNIDVAQNRELTLKDLLGEDYVNIANESIIRQMNERAAADENLVYWGVTENESSIDGFVTVDENTDFYINADGNPVVCFGEYEVAPGFMGIQEFEIEKSGTGQE
ncbi:MAG TPA: anti-sigma-V factor rsiV [Candidatus Eisenbergiella stercoravium]|nr:anti-sigma-V factor rsiV [Candidatus Eisenbergiella stercoravium]